jgi:NAD+ synthase (glutamine-hydrolysing)
VTRVRIACCQLDTVVGDLGGNVTRILSSLAEAEAAGADLAVFPELAVTGYPPEDLLLKPGFVLDGRAALERIAASTGRCAAVVGFVDLADLLYNAAAVCFGGRVVGVHRKRLLPNYAVFDEKRYFAAGSGPPQLFLIGGARVGVSICEDAWSATGPLVEEARGGADLVVNLNASPYYRGRLEERTEMLSNRAGETGCPVAYVNLVGGQDELVFDGASLVVDASGAVMARAAQFREETLVVDVDVDATQGSDVENSGTKARRARRGRPPGTPFLEVVEVSGAEERKGDRLVPSICPLLGPEEEVYEALVLGTRDYVTKNGFADALIGLSGGIDSSLVATVAVDALGAEHVHGVAMPSRFSSESSLSDATALAARLGIELKVVPIERAHAAFLRMLEDPLGGPVSGLTAENLQSRIRGVFLMALSNASGAIVLTTGNKSELATGYSTLYGDSAGGFAVIKDVPKTLVYRLCEWRNQRAGTDLVPESVLTKPPSAELRPDQRDDQSLPPYDVLDPVLAEYVEADRTAAEMVESGYDPELVERVVRLVDLAEYKRRQNPPGVRVTTKAFGKDRRVPITNRYVQSRDERSSDRGD